MYIFRCLDSGKTGPDGFQNEYCFISGSVKNIDKNSSNHPYFYLFEARKGIKCFGGKDYYPIIIDKNDHRRFTHAGGIQIAENILAIGFEDFQDSTLELNTDRSEVRFYDISDERNISEIHSWSISRSGKGEIASAIGLTKRNGQWIMAIRGKDFIDFYVSNNEKAGAEAFKFCSKVVFTKENNLKNYQALNLYIDDKNDIYMFGMPDGSSHDDKCFLHKLNIIEESRSGIVKELNPTAPVSFVREKHFKRSGSGDGPRFMYAACLQYDPLYDGMLSIHSAEGHVTNNKIRCNEWREKQ